LEVNGHVIIEILTPEIARRDLRKKNEKPQ
jgi:hypothetical protein